jgi:putative FmdB family regulatory protein
MPIYTYRCHVCGKEFDFKQSINDEPLKVCPDEICKEHGHAPGEVSRVISKNVGLIFKGSGFYLTDYARNQSVSSAPKTNGHSHSSSYHNNNENGNGNSNNSHSAKETTVAESKTTTDNSN